MKLHFLQHVWFEDLAYIKTWAKHKDIAISGTAFFANEQLPPIHDFDWLVIVGGPMGVYDEKQYPWLVEEKKFIEEAIAAGKTVLGICLGAQLLANVLGARVYKGRYKEIGWFDVSKTAEASESKIFTNLPDTLKAFQWHGDTFELPTGARRLAQSNPCPNQAFELNGRVLGLQFHLESTPESIDKLIKNCSKELIEGKYIQNASQITAQNSNVEQANRLMETLLDNMLSA